MAFSVLQSFIKNFTTGSETSLSLTITGVTSGSLIIVGFKWEGADGSEAGRVVTDTTNSVVLTNVTGSFSGNSLGLTDSEIAYYTAPSSGSISFTVATPGAFIRFIVLEVTPPASWAVDTSIGHQASSTAVSSGNITTTGTDEFVVVMYGENNPGSLSSQVINGSAPDGIIQTVDASAAQLWYKAFSSTFTGAATATISSSQQYSISVAAFKGLASLEQEGFRFRNDDGSESAATWLAAQDTNVSQPALTNTRLRALVNATADPASNQYQLEYRKVGNAEWHKLY